MRGMRIRPRARHALAWMLALLLVAGLMPVLPEVPKAFAEEADAIVLGNDVVDEGVPVEDDADATELGVAATAESADELCDTESSVVSEQGEALVLDKVVKDAPPDQLKLVASEDAVTVEDTVLEAQSVSVSNPRVRADSSMKAGQVATWDCVWFGSYPQTEVTPGDATYASLQSASWDANGDAMVGGKRYRRISKHDATYNGYWSSDGYGSITWRYFRYEPIKWRVLEVTDNIAFVVSDRALDDQCYNNNDTSVTWETSSIRSWLNGYGASSNQPGMDFSRKNFVDTAFSVVEKPAIFMTGVDNANNTYWSTAGGNDTRDKVFLLSEAEVCDASCGFVDEYGTSDEARICKGTDYAHAMGAWRDTTETFGGIIWWLRSPGYDADYAAEVYNFGYVYPDGNSVYNNATAIRPALRINLSSPHLRAAGIVSSDGDINEQAPTGTRSGTEEDTDGSIGGGSSEGTTNVCNPRVRTNSSMDAGQVTTWDCLWFGSYPQGEVSPGDALYANLTSATWDARGDAKVGGKKYHRIAKAHTTYSGYWSDDGHGSTTYRYFRYEPIKWRILRIDGGKALVVADAALDCQTYNTDWNGVTWETSSVRSWLNGYSASSNEPGSGFSGRGFLDAAFSRDELSAVLQTDLANSDNAVHGTKGGNGTRDLVFLLSEDEACDASFGFASDYSTNDEARICKATDYAHAMGAFRAMYDGRVDICCWWLRSPGDDDNMAVGVDDVGFVDADGYGVGNFDIAVRPALTLDLVSPQLRWAGTVSSYEVVNGCATKRITSVALGTTSFSYDGEAKTPEVIVTAGDETVPTSGYDVVYSNNVKAGTATVTVTGKCGFEGTMSAVFKIAAASLSKAKVTGVKGKTYTGKALTQAPTVKVGSRTLKKGTDYALSYKSNVKAGVATMTITGRGNYKGSKPVKFKIAKAANPMAVKAVTRTAKLATVRKKAVTVAAPLKLTKKAVGKVTYAKVAKGSSAELTVNKTTGKVTVKKGTKKGTFKIKIKVTAAGNSNYKALSKTITCKVVVM